MFNIMLGMLSSNGTAVRDCNSVDTVASRRVTPLLDNACHLRMEYTQYFRRQTAARKRLKGDLMPWHQ